MDALELIKSDHVAMKKLLQRGEDTTGRATKTRKELLDRIRTELGAHEIMEEEIFYPALKEHPKAKDIVLEGYEEHHVVDMVVGELERTPVEDETWAAKFKVMTENIEHHMEEEEGEMFKQARAVFDRAELQDLGDRMKAREEQALAELKAAAA